MTIDKAIEHAREVARNCDDSECAAEHMQLAEWLRQARGATKAARWYTSRICELDEENAKLRMLVDAWMGCGTRYHTMQGACPMFDENEEDFCKASRLARELGIEVE